MTKKESVEQIVNHIMVMTSQSMHYKKQCGVIGSDGILSYTPDAEGYYSPIGGTMLKIGLQAERTVEYTNKILKLIKFYERKAQRLKK